MKIDKETGLRNCPFCGGKAKYETQVEVEPVIDENGAYIDGDTFYSEYVHCPNCGIYTDLYDGEGEAITAWNRRYDSDEDDGKQEDEQ